MFLFLYLKFISENPFEEMSEENNSKNNNESGDQNSISNKDLTNASDESYMSGLYILKKDDIKGIMKIVIQYLVIHIFYIIIFFNFTETNVAIKDLKDKVEKLTEEKTKLVTEVESLKTVLTRIETNVGIIKTNVSSIKTWKTIIENMAISTDEIKTFVTDPINKVDNEIITFEELKSKHNLDDLPMLNNEIFLKFEEKLNEQNNTLYSDMVKYLNLKIYLD